MSMRLGLLLMDDLPERAVPVRGDYPALYNHLFRDLDVELVTVAVHQGQTPTSIRECDGWIVGGSRYSVYDDLEWIRTTEEIVRVAVATEHPIVGICFGHQLMAQALGGRTEQVGWGVGARHYDTIEPLAWFPEGEQRTTLLASHQDQVVELPAGATVWSASDYCPIAGMTIGAAGVVDAGAPRVHARRVRRALREPAAPPRRPSRRRRQAIAVDAVVQRRHRRGDRSVHRRLRGARASSTARSKIASSIGSVRRPVNVFCWLGWNEHSSVGPSSTPTSTPCPNLGRGRTPKCRHAAS